MEHPMGASPINFPNAGHFYSNITKPVDINLQFKVAASDAAGKGITSLKSNGYVASVYMHTSATAATGSPNPAAGLAVITLAGNFNHFLGQHTSIQSPNSGSSLKVDNGATLTIGNAYVITILGNATAAQWATLGVPAGITPAVGTSFIALATGAGSGNTSTSRVQAQSVSGITTVEVVGTPDSMISNSNSSANGGAELIVQFLGATNSSTTTLIPTAPTDGTIINMKIRMDASSVTVDGL
jgi:hypothetical protein